MVRKIETEERTRLDPSTVSDLLKLNNDEPYYMSQHLVRKNNNNMLSMAKSATATSLKK